MSRPFSYYRRFLYGPLLVLLFWVLPFAAHAGDYVYPLILNKQGDTLFSPLIEQVQSFNAVILTFAAPVTGLEVNFSSDPAGPWEPVTIHDDGFGADGIVFHTPFHQVQFRKKALSGEFSLTGQITLLPYESDHFASDAVSDSVSASTGSSTEIGFRIIGRREWGADESVRLWNPTLSDSDADSDEKTPEDACSTIAQQYPEETSISNQITSDASGQPYVWPLSYSKKIHKIVVHHTDSEVRDLNGDSRTDAMDMKGIMRAIYRYHAVTRGWGDIGYNYVIDPFGNIYEGRYGGEGVIGAHVLCHNNGSLGIAIIGDYENNEVSAPAQAALTYLIAQKSRLHRLDPDKDSSFRGKFLSNVVGHRDLRPTSCPGMKLYSLLPLIRKKASILLRGADFSDQALTAATLDYNAELVSDVNVINLHPTQVHSLSLKFRNTGKQTWDQNTWLHVALNNQKNIEVVPLIADKRFVAADLKESQVAPGGIGTFDIQIAPHYQAGFYTFELSPVLNGRYKISRSAVVVPIMVDQAQFGYRTHALHLPSGILFQGQKIQASVELQNTGNITWRNFGPNRIALGADHPRDRQSMFVKENPSRLAYLKESEVPPGGIGHFIFALDIPRTRIGEWQDYFTPVIEGVRWLEDQNLNFAVNIKKPKHLAVISIQEPNLQLLPGETRELKLTMENKGDVPWTEDVMETLLLGHDIKVFKSSIVPVAPVLPGKTASYSFWVEAPYRAGTYSVSLKSRFNGLLVKGGTGKFIVRVSRPVLRAQLVKQSDANLTLTPGEEKTLTVQFKNTGNTIWRNKGARAVYLGTNLPHDRPGRLYYESGWVNRFRPAVLKEAVVQPGEVGTFTFSIKPAKQGIYRESFQLILENVGWIEGSEVQWLARVYNEKATPSVPVKTPVQPREAKYIPIRPSSPASIPVTSPKVKSLRVKLSYEALSTTIVAEDDYRLEDETGVPLFTVPKNTFLTVNVGANIINVQDGQHSISKKILRLVPQNPGGIFKIQSWEHRPTWNLTLNDNEFRGALEIRLVNNKPAYINELPLEDYLKGIAEVSDTHPAEKLKTIAVLARTYAAFYLDPSHRKFPGLPYDGSDDPAIFQRYLGYGYEKRSPHFIQAVTDTAGHMVSYQGVLIKTPYFNQSDGRTRSAEEVWGWKDTPYLQSVADSWCEEKVLKGHGVGLSGCGATELAKQGKTYEEIIRYYYQGVEIGKR